jgi:CRISPR-associated exonuclease Cas4
MQVTATLITYQHTCHRKLWLHAHEIRMEHTSDLVAEGRLIGETTYQRRPERYTQVELDGVKIDFFDPHTRTVHETKRGRAIEAAHRAQVQFYLYKLRQHGVPDASVYSKAGNPNGWRSRLSDWKRTSWINFYDIESRRSIW